MDDKFDFDFIKNIKPIQLESDKKIEAIVDKAYKQVEEYTSKYGHFLKEYNSGYYFGRFMAFYKPDVNLYYYVHLSGKQILKCFKFKNEESMFKKLDKVIHYLERGYIRKMNNSLII